MTQHEALKLLDINELSDATDAIEESLFQLKQQIISKSYLPQFLIAREKKLMQLEKIASVLNVEINNKIKPLNINILKTINLIETFNNYQNNKALILSQISSELSFENFKISLKNLSANLKIYASSWPEINPNKETELLLSKELDNMEMLSILKELKSKNIINVNDLASCAIPISLELEIKRLNAINKQFNSCS